MRLKQTEAFLKRKSKMCFHAAIENLPFDFFALDENRFLLSAKFRFALSDWGNLIGKRPQDIKVDDAPSQYMAR